MSFLKKNIGLIVGGGIALVLVIGALALLVRFRGDYARVQRELRENLNRLEDLQQMDPFPSEENVARVEQSLQVLERYRDGLLDALASGQSPVQRMERAEFPAAIERASGRLRNLANQAGVVLPENMVFGFQQYERGNLPLQEHVPRLVTQLRTIEGLVAHLFSAEIAELIEVEREVFDLERARGDDFEGRRGFFDEEIEEPAARIAPHGVAGLYTRERYRLQFWASDAAVREVLNRFAASPSLVIVRSVELHNEMARDGTNPARRLADRLERREGRRRDGVERRIAERSEDAPPLLHEDRVVAGRERVRVMLVVDVYRFEHGEGPS